MKDLWLESDDSRLSVFVPERGPGGIKYGFLYLCVSEPGESAGIILEREDVEALVEHLMARLEETK